MNSIYVKLKKFPRTLRSYYERKLPSLEHQVAWSKFERVLMYRANVCFTSKFIFTCIFMALGKANWQQSREFIDEGGEHNS